MVSIGSIWSISVPNGQSRCHMVSLSTSGQSQCHNYGPYKCHMISLSAIMGSLGAIWSVSVSLGRSAMVFFGQSVTSSLIWCPLASLDAISSAQCSLSLSVPFGQYWCYLVCIGVLLSVSVFLG